MKLQEITALSVSIGDEILFGQTLDTNSHKICGMLSEAGVRVLEKITIADRPEAVKSALAKALQTADIAIFTGGLGPTKDDLTKKSAADFFGLELKESPEVLAHLKELFAAKNREMSDLNRQQALVPVGADFIHNRVGTAPGLWFERDGRVIIMTPGVPHETMTMMEEQIMPRLRKKFRLPVLHHKIIRTANLPESTLSERIEEWENALPAEVKLAYLPTFSEVKLRLSAYGESAEELQKMTDRLAEGLKPLIGKYIYSEENIELNEALGRAFLAKNLSVSVAESCTGGYVAHRISEVPGCSAYFKGSITAYSNDVKMSALEVKEETLAAHGAVSEETAREMAEGVRRVLGTDVGAAVTGVAGPGGGSPEKPVGTIWVAFADKNGTHSRKLSLTKERYLNIRFTTTFVLDGLRRMAAGEEML